MTLRILTTVFPFLNDQKLIQSSVRSCRTHSVLKTSDVQDFSIHPQCQSGLNYCFYRGIFTFYINEKNTMIGRSLCSVCVLVFCTDQSGEGRSRLSQGLAPHTDQVVHLPSACRHSSCGPETSKSRGPLPGQLTHPGVQTAGQRQQLLTCEEQTTRR